MKHRKSLLAIASAVALALGAAVSATFAHPPGHEDDGHNAAVVGNGWTLAAAESRLSFVSIKNDSVAEVHRFPTLGGTVGGDGKVALEIALDAVETGLPVRNERLRVLLFDTAKHPVATVTMQVDAAAVQGLRVGKSLVLRASATLALHGLSGEVPGEFRITRMSSHQWLVTTEAPLIINAAAFGLADGVAALREIARLQAIAAAVPVTASLLFNAAER